MKIFRSEKRFSEGAPRAKVTPLTHIIEADVIYHPPKFRNRLPFELQCSATTHFKGFAELSSFPLYLGRFGARKMV